MSEGDDPKKLGSSLVMEVLISLRSGVTILALQVTSQQQYELTLCVCTPSFIQEPDFTVLNVPDQLCKTVRVVKCADATP